MVVQHAITHLSDGLIPGLNYAREGENTAHYIHSSKFVKFRPEAGDRYSPGAARVIRFRLVDDCWLNSLRMQVTLNNLTVNGAGQVQPIQPIGPALGMFTSARLFLGGQVVEQIDELAPLATIIDRLKPRLRRYNESIQTHPMDENEAVAVMPGGSSRRLLFDLPFGIFRQHRFIPLHIVSQLVIELTLGDAPQAFDGNNVNFSLSDVALLGTCLHVNSHVTDVYHKHLESGLNKLPLPFQSITSSRHVVTNSEFSLSLSRSLHMLKQLYFVLVSNNEKPIAQHRQRVGAMDQLTIANDIMSFQVQIGSARFPDTECVGVSESFFRLMQACGHEKDHDDIAINPMQFVGTSAVFGIDFEKAGNEALYSGISTRDGKVMTLTIKNSQVTAVQTHTVFVYQVYDGVCNILRGAVEVTD